MENSLSDKIKLNNGLEMPLVGLGTYKLENVIENVKTAIKNGYRHIDTAKFYNNEVEIGQAVNECISEGLIKREDIFITTKLWQDDHENACNALKAALVRLNLDYVDLYLFHWPFGIVEDGKLVKKVPVYKVWAGLEECVSQGLTKSIGVSNFNTQLLFDLISYCKIQPVVNQLEIHPLFAQYDLVEFCQRFDIAVTAYNPLLRGSCITRYPELLEKYDLFNNKTILGLASKYGKTPAQIILNWHIKRKIAIIPKSGDALRQLENFECSHFKMTDGDYESINQLDLNKRFNSSKWKDFSGGIEIFA